MGNCRSRVWQDREEKGRLHEREMQIEKGVKKSYKRGCKVLVLGSSNSGKSTIMKQMKILHQNGYSDEELMTFRPLIWKNLVECVHAVVEGLEKFDLVPIQPHNKASRRRLMEYTASDDGDFYFDHAIAREAHDLWTDDIIPVLMEHSFEFDLMDSAFYFFENSQRIGQKDYLPSEEDVLRARERSTGITQAQFIEGQLLMHLYDISGPWLEPKQWVHSFESVTSIIFCAALSDYDQLVILNENGMAESLALFDSIVNSYWFLGTSIILFLTKIDIFQRKLLKIPLEKSFPEYTRGSDVRMGAKYILWSFMKLNRARLSVYPHVLDATRTSDIRLVFVTVKETVLQNQSSVSDLL
ncbi:guanine nucleotide regulatory protein [Peniophora sp. CONT]|nr:guanine nucleotide regulatory protein [Peniophora sp. CONT]